MNQGISRQELVERELLSRPVSGLQYMLGQLARSDPRLMPLVVDGVFGERTLEAVMVFQREYGLGVTGIVDRRTWDAIRDRWLEGERKNGETRATQIFPSEGIRVREGETREYMILPQTMFQVLARQLQGISPDEADGVHGRASADNVRWLQRASGLPETGTMDKAAWDMLSRLYEVFVVRDLTDRPEFSGGWG